MKIYNVFVVLTSSIVFVSFFHEIGAPAYSTTFWVEEFYQCQIRIPCKYIANFYENLRTTRNYCYQIFCCFLWLSVLFSVLIKIQGWLYKFTNFYKYIKLLL